jgi:hypothetical protein
MAGSRNPGPQCTQTRPVEVDDGTTCRAETPAPRPVGSGQMCTPAVGELLRSRVSLGPTWVPSDGKQVRASSWAIEQIQRASYWSRLEPLAYQLLGPYSFDWGVCCGIVENLAGSIIGLLDLLKLFVLNGLYERAHQPAPWWARWEPDYVIARGTAILLDPQLKEAHDQCLALIRDLKYAVMHPLEFLGAVRDQYVAKWKRCETLSAQHNLGAQFEAGKISGELLLDLLFLIGAGEAAVKVAGEIPELAKWAERLKGVVELKPRTAMTGASGVLDEVTNEVEGAARTVPTAANTEETVYRGKLRGEDIELPGVETRRITYTKREPSDTAALRRVFDSEGRANFLNYLSTDPERAAELRDAGFSEQQIQAMRDYGKAPIGWNVHHKLPLDDGGTNNFANLVLIENEPYHKTITVAQKALTGTLSSGQSATIDFPVPSGYVYPPTRP